MRVLHIHYRPCARAYKIARGIRTARPEWFQGIAYTRKLPGHEEVFDAEHTFQYDRAMGLAGAIRRSRPDVIHSHNEPDLFTVAALGSGVPVVHDVHDLTTRRMTPEETLRVRKDNVPVMERRACEGAAAVICATPQLLAWVREAYNVRRSMVFESRMSSSAFTSGVPGGGLSIVYQGGLVLPASPFAYRNYWGMFDELADAGLTVTVYPAAVSKIADEAARHRVDMRETIPHADLIHAIARHHYALVGFNFDGCHDTMRAYCDAALPNKFFDAMAAGVPVIVRNCETVARIVAEYGVGLIWNGGDIGQEARDRWPELRQNVLDRRDAFAMEAQIEDLIGLYEEVAG